LSLLNKYFFLSTRAGEGVELVEDRVRQKPIAGTARIRLLFARALYLADLRADQCWLELGRKKGVAYIVMI
jgi:hypothetical protein